MKTFYGVIAAGLLAGGLNGYAQSAAPAAKPEAAKTTAGSEPWKKIVIPPLHAFKPVQPKKIVLENGLVLFLQEDHELPFVSGSILIRGGSRDERPFGRGGAAGRRLDWSRCMGKHGGRVVRRR